MDLTALTHPDCVLLRQTFTDRDQALRKLAESLMQQGKLQDVDLFLADVLAREAQGPTALGEGLAVPHGKSAAVASASFALATLAQPLAWQGIDGDEQVNLIILLAIPPQEAGSTHIQLLTELTSRLVDDEVREQLLAATCPEQVFALLNAQPEQPPAAPQPAQQKPTIVCVTACPAGIAHTFMAAEYLEKAGRQMGINVHVETQGANGIEGRLTPEQLRDAHACIFAAEVAVKEAERFAHLPCLSVPVAEPIRRAPELLQQALALEPVSTKQRPASTEPAARGVKAELKQALLSGISYAVPLIVAGGTVLAVAVLLAQIFGLQHLFDLENSWLWMYRKLGGGMLGTLMVPVLAAYTAYSLADKPALAPGFAAGLAANMIGAGFLGQHDRRGLPRRRGRRPDRRLPDALGEAPYPPLQSVQRLPDLLPLSGDWHLSGRQPDAVCDRRASGLAE